MLPSIVILAMLFLSLGISLSEHGKPKTGNNNFWVSLIANSITIAILYWGGFFNALIAAIKGGG